jgi:hypothetical protein
MTSSQHAPHAWGDTRNIMVNTIRSNPDQRKVSESDKVNLSSDWGLQLAPMKSELLVIAGQLYGGEYVPGLCTHRPSHRGNRHCSNPLA